MLLLIHRNWGIDHDATLYFGQALAQHSPGMFAGDLFFLHGSQAALHAVPVADRALAELGGSAAPVFLGRTGRPVVFCGLQLVLPASAVVRSIQILGLAWRLDASKLLRSGDHLQLCRTFPDPAPVFRGAMPARHWIDGTQPPNGWPCLRISGRPVSSVTGHCRLHGALALADPARPPLATLLWAGVPIVAAAGMGLAPFDGLLRPLDANWLTQLRAINGQLFVSGWARQDYAIAVFDALLLGCGWKSLEPRFARWCLAALLGLALGIGASLVLVDGLHLELPVALQLWRVHWLAHWLAMVSLALLLQQELSRRNFPQALLLGLTGLLVWLVPEGIWLPFTALLLAWPRLAIRLQPHARTLLGALFALGITLLTLQFASNEWLNFRQSGSQLDLYAIDKRLFAYPLVALGLPLTGLWLWSRASSPLRILLFAALLLPACVLAGLRWDIRTPTRRALDAHANSPDLFGADLPKDATVYWDSMSLLGTWSVLRRSDYYDPQQLSGLAFNRGTVTEALARIARLESLMNETYACQQRAQGLDAPDACTLSRASLEAACTPGGSRPPDFLILPFRQSGPSRGNWTMTDPATSMPIARFWLYRCSDFASSRRPGSGPGSGLRSHLQMR